MKKWLYLMTAAAAVGVLSRLPHPARDISKLAPVEAVYLYIEEGSVHIRTDDGDHGAGMDLAEAEADMRAQASAEIYLDTAAYLILDPKVPITEEFFTILDPACFVCFTSTPPDLPDAAKYLSAHEPELRLSHLRAELYDTR